MEWWLVMVEDDALPDLDEFLNEEEDEQLLLMQRQQTEQIRQPSTSLPTSPGRPQTAPVEQLRPNDSNTPQTATQGLPQRPQRATTPAQHIESKNFQENNRFDETQLSKTAVEEDTAKKDNSRVRVQKAENKTKKQKAPKLSKAEQQELKELERRKKVAENLRNVNERKSKGKKYRIEPPEKIKGKLVLEYGDGTKRIRPPLMDLVQHNSKLAKQAFIEEYPEALRVWWDRYRYTAKVPALAIGLLIGLAIAAMWFFVTPMIGSIQQIPQTPYNGMIIGYLTLISTALSATASIVLFCSGMMKRRKDLNTLPTVEEEDFGRTVLRFVPVAFFYGPLCIVVGLVQLIFGLISFFSAVAKAT